VPSTSSATRRRAAGGRRARRGVPLLLAAVAGLVTVLSGCHSDQNVSRAYDCSKGKEYQESSSCHTTHTSQAPGAARVQASPQG
jgi:hypothetical protein